MISWCSYEIIIFDLDLRSISDLLLRPILDLALGTKMGSRSGFKIGTKFWNENWEKWKRSATKKHENQGTRERGSDCASPFVRADFGSETGAIFGPRVWSINKNFFDPNFKPDLPFNIDVVYWWSMEFLLGYEVQESVCFGWNLINLCGVLSCGIR